MTMPDALVCFAHGKESGPWGTKITHLAETAKRHGCAVLSPDYSHTHDPRARVAQLLELAPRAGTLVLVGSSMGGHVSTAASRLLRTAGLFLMAPAFYMPGFEEQTPQPADCPIAIVHGWRDDVVPVENSFRFAREHRATLHVLDTDHRMQDRIREIGYYFEYFLVTLDKFGT